MSALSRGNRGVSASSTSGETGVGGYERIKVVGKGSFGSAILYRRRADNTLVVLKEINMLELSVTERQLSLNEVVLLSRMDHPHIISYYDSFEENGILMIEMEYADGGTLAQYLARCTDYIPEAEILYMFEQMCSAVAYLHDNNVLHRDLKTANVFLTLDRNVKLGDFGISKLMGTETRFAGAQTVVGTPYYISPEMCEGRSYNAKSDVWALGCILYEMACLQKTFEGTNLPALITKIIRGDYEAIKGPYSTDVKLLVRDMLQVNPAERPSANEILATVQQYRGKKPGSDMTMRRLLDANYPPNCHSALYEFDLANVTLSAVSNLPPKIRVKQLSIGANHQALLTIDGAIYAWGNNKFGQLGLGHRESKDSPTRVTSLDGKEIRRVACGATFSVFCGDRGIAMVCGESRFSGNGRAGEDSLRPQLVNCLLREDIVDMSAGDEHVAAVCGGGQVYVWGNGKYGQLGTGCTDHVYHAQKIELPPHFFVINVKCGPDATALLTSCGTLIAMGSNKFNKLNLKTRFGFFAHLQNTKDDSENILSPMAVKAFNTRVVDVRLGHFHSGVLLESGHVHVFGRNVYGELGVGHCQPCDSSAPFKPVKALMSKTCVQLFCGDGFTVTATSDNELYFWGTKGVRRRLNDTITIEDLEQGTTHIVRSFSATSTTTQKSCSAKSRWGFKRDRPPTDDGLVEDVTTVPALALRLDATKSASGNRPFIKLSQVAGWSKRVFVVINTSPAAPMDNTNRYATMVSIDNYNRGRRQSAPELNKDGTVPTWVQNELDDSEVLNYTFHMTPKRRQNGWMTDPSSEELQLRSEIETLRLQVSQHTNAFQGHETEMKLLQQKVSELQQLHARNEPPPAYPTSAKNRHSATTKTVQNVGGHMPETKVCSIL
uniref:non-specific serine/threonine protein kinase n=2 Tax=Panagrellus redivivus TaxID=6233 RepID=A0A7E4W2J0_PANRE